MKTLTLAESFITINPARPTQTARWVGAGVSYIHLTLTLDRRGLLLTASIPSTSKRWTARGFKAWRLFEQLADTTVTDRIGLAEPKGMDRAA